MKFLFFVLLLSSAAQAAPLSRAERIERRLERIERNLNRLIEERRNRLNQIGQFESCNEKCIRDNPMSDDDRETPWENTPRAECFRQCDKIRPVGLGGEC
jgi:hypothetical protein